MTRGAPISGQNRPGRFDKQRADRKPARRKRRRSLIGALFFWTATAAVWGVVLAAGRVRRSIGFKIKRKTLTNANHVPLRRNGIVLESFTNLYTCCIIYT